MYVDEKQTVTRLPVRPRTVTAQVGTPPGSRGGASLVSTTCPQNTLAPATGRQRATLAGSAKKLTHEPGCGGKLMAGTPSLPCVRAGR